MCFATGAGAVAISDYPDRAEQYFRCGACGGFYLHPLPQGPFNEAFESPATAAKMDEIDIARHEYFLRRLGWLNVARTSDQQPRLLDVGCATGRLMALAQERERGWSVEGIEPSPELAAFAKRNNPGAPVFEADFVEFEGAPGPFDAIVALDVIEHVAEPERLIVQARKRLRPDGFLLLQTPNAESLRARMHGAHWNMLIPEYHFRLFTRRGLEGLLQAQGFEVVRTTTASGSGRETGLRRLASLLRERVLAAGGLGNALLILARRVG
jgi:SAM-dependent methyltransferase